ncbi:MAG: hypothetical protein ACSLFR_15110 [Solirubrobacteraceae bacterium]
MNVQPDSEEERRAPEIVPVRHIVDLDSGDRGIGVRKVNAAKQRTARCRQTCHGDTSKGHGWADDRGVVCDIGEPSG